MDWFAHQILESSMELTIYINKVTVRVFVADNFPYILPYSVTDIPSVCEKQKKHNVTDIPSVCE